MATQIINADPQAINTVRISRTDIANQILQVANSEALLRVTVSGFDNQGKGLLSINGQIVPAQLPPNLQIGDRFLAKVAAVNEQVLLQIIESATESVEQASTPLERLTSQINKVLRESPGALQSPQDWEVPTELIKASKELVQKNKVGNLKSMNIPGFLFPFWASTLQGT